MNDRIRNLWEAICISGTRYWFSFSTVGMYACHKPCEQQQMSRRRTFRVTSGEHTINPLSNIRWTNHKPHEHQQPITTHTLWAASSEHITNTVSGTWWTYHKHCEQLQVIINGSTTESHSFKQQQWPNVAHRYTHHETMYLVHQQFLKGIRYEKVWQYKSLCLWYTITCGTFLFVNLPVLMPEKGEI